LTWGDVTWRRRESSLRKSNPIVNLLDLDKKYASGTGTVWVTDAANNNRGGGFFVLGPAEESGDSTVPARSGRAPIGQKGVRTCVSYKGISHEGAFKKVEARLFSLWAIVKIAQNVKGTALEYK